MTRHGQRGEKRAVKDGPKRESESLNAERIGYRKPIDGVTSTRYRSLRDPSKNKGLTRVGLLHGRGMVCPIRSDRYSTPPYNLHGLMTSITLLHASTALRTARVVRSLGHGLRYATPVDADSRPSAVVQNTRDTRGNTGRRARLYSCSRGAMDFATHPASSAFAFYWRRVQKFSTREVSSLYYAPLTWLRGIEIASSHCVRFPLDLDKDGCPEYNSIAVTR